MDKIYVNIFMAHTWRRKKITGRDASGGVED